MSLNTIRVVESIRVMEVNTVGFDNGIRVKRVGSLAVSKCSLIFCLIRIDFVSIYNSYYL